MAYLLVGLVVETPILVQDTDANDEPSPGWCSGNGLDYCFKMMQPLEHLLKSLLTEIPYRSLLLDGGGNAMAPGNYQPEESFLTNFIGCPINGMDSYNQRQLIL